VLLRSVVNDAILGRFLNYFGIKRNIVAGIVEQDRCSTRSTVPLNVLIARYHDVPQNFRDSDAIQRKSEHFATEKNRK
jgi:hypothetical protein